MLPRTPVKTGKECDRYVRSLNQKFELDLPPVAAPPTPGRDNPSIAERCVKKIKTLHFRSDDGSLARVEKDLEQRAKDLRTEWVYKPGQEKGTLPTVGRKPGEKSFLSRPSDGGVAARNSGERMALLKTLLGLLDAEYYLIENKVDIHRATGASSPSDGSSTTTRNLDPPRPPPQQQQRQVHNSAPQPAPAAPEQQRRQQQSPSKRRLNGNQEASPRKEKQQKIHKYYTASGKRDSSNQKYDDASPLGHSQAFADKKQHTVNDYMKVSKADTSHGHSFDSKPKLTREMSAAEISFATTATTSGISAGFSFDDGGASTVATSFASDQYEKEPQSPDSVEELFQSDQLEKLVAASNLAANPKPEYAQDSDECIVREIVQELEQNGPFAKRRTCDSTIPFRYRYEAERIANANGVPIANILTGNELPCEDYNNFWSHILTQCQNSHRYPLTKSKDGPWDMAVDQYRDTRAETDDLVTLGGHLIWSEKSEDGWFKFNLNPLRFERGNRLSRRFGSDRFLEVAFPALNLTGFPQYLKKYKPSLILRGVARWLATSDHYIAGRVWRGFYLEDVKKKESQESKVHLFAVDGDDFVKLPLSQDVPPSGQSSEWHTPMSVKSLINWHIPLAENLEQSDCKLFQRLALGLSRTVPTVVVYPEEVVELEHEKGKPIMNDGCARISRSLARHIADHLGVDATPSCFQARIAGAKGIWMVARDDGEFEAGDRNFWIEISSSQLKIGPHPVHRNKVRLDNQQLNFEVVSWSRPLRPASLNMQLLMILQHGGVRKDHLENLIEREISQSYQEFKDIVLCDNNAACRRWLQHKGYDESTIKRKTRRVDGFPPSNMEQAILLVESGFLPFKLPYLTELFRSFLADHLKRFDKMQIQISRSTYAYCLADPYGILKENEVHLAFSRSWEEHGYHGAELDDVDVLVARLPAHRPSDIQKRRAVYKKELRHFRDVVVFPTVGERPLASELSGGDYDGDEPWICWDPDIVNAFENTPYQPDGALEPADLGLVNLSTRMDQYDLFNRNDSTSFDNFLARVFSVNAVPSQLGLCTVQHEKLCYHRNRIDSPDATKLADLLGYLVDARKAGYELPPECWKKLRGDLGLNGLAAPAYKEQKEHKEDQQTPNPDNIIDYLKFNVIKNQSEKVIADFACLRQSKDVGERDADLIREWKRVWDQAISEKNDGKPFLLNVVQKIEQSVINAQQTWTPLARKLPYSEMIDRASELLEEVRPPPQEDGGQLQIGSSHPWINTWLCSEESWAAFRASCAYNCFPSGKFPWYAAGTTLCLMKARASGQVRMVIWPVYTTLKVDKKAARRQLEESLRSNGSDEDEGVKGLEKDDESDDGTVDEYMDAQDGFETEIDSDFDDADWISLV